MITDINKNIIKKNNEPLKLIKKKLHKKKLCFIGDTHGYHRSFQNDINGNKIDVLIHSGDWSGSSNLDRQKDMFFDLIEWFYFNIDVKTLVLVPGNHELWIESQSRTKIKNLIKKIVAGLDNANGKMKNKNIVFLQDEFSIIHGIGFYGSPYSNEFFNWAFMENEPGLKTIFSKIPKKTDVLITHGPAFGINDQVEIFSHLDCEFYFENTGSFELLDIIKKYKIPIHVSGHIHESYGQMILDNDTLHVCSSVLDEKYQKPPNFKIQLL